MRILYVTVSLPHGANEAFVIPEVNALADTGHEVLIVPRSPGGGTLHARELVAGSARTALFAPRVLYGAAATGLRNPGRAAASVRPLFKSRTPAIALKNAAVIPKGLWLADLASRWGAEHIHCHWGGTTATMAMIASRVSGVPWSLTVHRWDIVENNLLAQKAATASFVRFISGDGLRMAQAIGLPGAKQCRVLHMGVAIPPTAARFAGPQSVVLCPARLVEVKGHRHLLKAWQMLRGRSQAACELWLAGGGELMGELESLSRSLGIADSVSFLGAIPHREILRLYERGVVSAVVLASVDLGGGNHEGIPVGLIEAMSYGVPVVATRSGGTAELVVPGTGLLVPPADAAALADALHHVLEDHGLHRLLGNAARRRVAEDFDVLRVTAEMANAFRESRKAGSPAVALSH